MLIYHKNIYDQVTLDVFFTKKNGHLKVFAFYLTTLLHTISFLYAFKYFVKNFQFFNISEFSIFSCRIRSGRLQNEPTFPNTGRCFTGRTSIHWIQH